MAFKIDYAEANQRLQELVKKQLKEKGIYKTGSLYNSIKVESDNGTWSIIGNDYFIFLDEKYKLLDDIVDSFGTIVRDMIIDQFQKEIDDNLSKASGN